MVWGDKFGSHYRKKKWNMGLKMHNSEWLYIFKALLTTLTIKGKT